MKWSILYEDEEQVQPKRATTLSALSIPDVCIARQVDGSEILQSKETDSPLTPILPAETASAGLTVVITVIHYETHWIELAGAYVPASSMLSDLALWLCGLLTSYEVSLPYFLTCCIYELSTSQQVEKLTL